MIAKYFPPLFIFLCLLFLTFISIIHPIIPLSYDEIWNYTNISSYGPLFSITNYPFANNHVFFTFLQSLTVPQNLLWHVPESVRILNVLVGTAFAILMYQIVHTFLNKKSPFWGIFAFVTCFFISPLVTPFFIVGRGYLLGMVLLLFGIYLLSQKREWSASLFFILSGWTVVTYIYCLPLIYISATIIAKKNEWKKIILSAFFICMGLYICYKPILLLVLSQGMLWSVISHQAFFLTTWQSLSYLSVFTFGNIGVGITGIAYITSIIQCIRQPKKDLRYFIFLLTSAIISYLSTIGFLSFFHIANPPYDRAGIFIPIFVGITIMFAAIQSKTVWIKYFLLLTLSLNTLVGMYFFITSLPNTSANHYPFNISYLAPSPYPISNIERNLLKEKMIQSLTVPISGDDTFQKYYSNIYHVPLTYQNQVETPISQPMVNPSQSTISAIIIPRSPTSPWLLPTSPFYFLKKVWQSVSLQTITFFSISKKPRILYLLRLSDITYKEGELLWQNNKQDLAIKTLYRAEHFITIVSGEIGDLVGLEHQGTIVSQDILPSISLHRNSITELMNTATNDQKKELDTLQSISLMNLENIQ